MKKDLKIGIALGSGSARGLAHIGVLKVLQEAGIKIDFIAGSSIGAMIGAAYALYGDITPLLETAYKTTKKPIDLMIDPAFPIKGIVSGKKIESLLDDFGFRGKEFRDLKIPTIIIATDILRWRKVALTQGSLTKAIRASISIPGIFSPVKYGDTYLVDGGVTDPVPVKPLRDAGVDFVIGVGLFPPPDISITWDLKDGNKSLVPIDQEIEERKAFYEFILRLGKEKVLSGINWLKTEVVEGPNIIETIFTSINIMQRELSFRSLEKADIAIVSPELKGFNLLDFHKAGELIEKGEKAAKKILPLLEKKLEEKDKSALLIS